jgi:hypothetical protein
MRKIVTFLCLSLAIAGHCQAQVCGCTDPMATNYNAKANINDGSCKYAPAKIKATVIGSLDSLTRSSSSLFYWKNDYWSYNDHKDRCLYRLDSTNAAIKGTLCVKRIRNHDTEEIAQDSQYLYFGDVGNNKGNRQNLRIYRINKKSIENQKFEVDTIQFSYEDQTDFTPNLMANDYDCEAFIVTRDSIYLFTKQWVSAKTTVYSLPKTPGTHVAHRGETYNVKGLVTGATYVPEYQLVVLCGYDYDKRNIFSALHPFIYLLYDFQDGFLFSGNKRRLDFGSGVKAQIEAIATSNGLDYYITNEHFKTTYMGFNIDLPARLQYLDLREYILPFLNAKRKNNIID